MDGKGFSKKSTNSRMPPKVFACPSCGASVAVRALGMSVTAICMACSTAIDTTNENYQIIAKALGKTRYLPELPLGQRGKLHGCVWEVVGFLVRSDGSDIYHWYEYLLFNPLRGFRWLTEFEGHWNYVVTTKEKPTTSSGRDLTRYYNGAATYLGKTYALFHRGKAKVVYVIGEFYWRIKINDEVSVADYVAPPEILSCETSTDEVVWSIGEYIAASEIQRAFGIAKPLAPSRGVAPNQPSTVTVALPGILKSWLIFLIFAFSIQYCNFVGANRNQVFQGDFVYRSNEPGVQTSPTFTLTRGLANLAVTLSAPLNNNWLEAEYILISEGTGKNYEFRQNLEFYEGWDDEGHWSEGNRTNQAILSSVPGGEYHLRIEVSGSRAESFGRSQPIEVPFSVTVTRDVTTWSNFLWVLLLLSVFPAWIWWQSRRFEIARWSNSDFSPHWSERDT